MTERSKQQKIGSSGHKWAIAHIEEQGDWIAREMNEDFGVDAEAELDENGVKGEILKLQFKTSEVVAHKNNLVELVIERKYIEYAQSCRYPVIFIRIDLTQKEAWYLWLQEWILQRRANDDDLMSQGSHTVWLPETKTLASGLAGELRNVARWRGETQLTLSLLDAMRSAAASYNETLVEALTSLLCQAAPLVSNAALDVIILESSLLGNNLRGTRQGLAISNQLLKLVRRFGDRTSVRTIDAMVLREDVYSRTGLAGLSILYDEFFGHISSLGLPSHFVALDLPDVAYYCALREAKPGSNYWDYLFAGAGVFRFAGLRFDCPNETFFANKYANRGASAILDYLIYDTNDELGALTSDDHLKT